MSLRQAAQQALEALERIWEGGLENLSDATHERVMEELSAALAEPEQEPVMWRNLDRKCVTHHQETAELWRQEGAKVVPLYTAPTPRKPVELTDGEIRLLMDGRGEEGDDDYVPPAFDDFGISEDDLTRFARAVIAAYEAKQGQQT